MQPSPENAKRPAKPQGATEKELEQMTDKQRQELQDPAIQEQNRREMLRQLRLRQCPGCGEDGIF